jgi:NAD(P)-dependent dehydrogenase (short-subunit alcohol dehydrogenase family)
VDEFAAKKILVTGASRGIGRAVALAFAQAGAQIAVHYHQHSAAARETLASLPGQNHHLFQADLADPQEAEAMIKDVIKMYAGIDILVNNAGIYSEHRITEISYPDWLAVWNHTLRVNLLGPANVCYWAVRQMIKQKSGRIINIGSRGAYRGEPDAPAYGASKAGLHAMTQSLAKALAPYHIVVTAVAPGWVDTDMAGPYLQELGEFAIAGQSPLGRIARPEEIAQTVLFLADNRNEFITGAVVDVNGASYLRS